MTDEPNQPHADDRPDTPADAALDRLLRSAAWPEPDATAVRRLTRLIVEERRRPLRLPRWARATAAAAALVGLCYVGWHHSPFAARHRADVTMRPPVHRPMTPPSAGETLPVAASISSGRPATLLETRILLAAERKTVRGGVEKTASRPAGDEPAEPPADRADIIRAARQMLASRPQAADALHESDTAARLVAVAVPIDWPLVRACALRPSTRQATLAALTARSDDIAVDFLLEAVLDASLRPGVLAALKQSPRGPTPALLAKFDAPRMDRRWAAAVALGRCADDNTLARLADMAEQGRYRRESIAALIASDTPAARTLLARVAKTGGAAPHVAPVRQAIAVLIARDAAPRFLFPNES